VVTSTPGVHQDPVARSRRVHRGLDIGILAAMTVPAADLQHPRWAGGRHRKRLAGGRHQQTGGQQQDQPAQAGTLRMGAGAGTARQGGLDWHDNLLHGGDLDGQAARRG
jgi:hypothetical protein